MTKIRRPASVKGSRQAAVRSRDSQQKATLADLPRANEMEASHPEAAGIAMADLAADPWLKAKDLAAQLGLPQRMVEAMIRRARTRNVAVKMEMHNVQNKQLAQLFDDRLYRALQWADDDLMAQASLRDLGYFIDRMLSARQLIRGEPTSIVAFEDRRKLNELMPLLINEAKRRGFVLDGQGTIVREPALIEHESEDEDIEDAPA